MLESLRKSVSVPVIPVKMVLSLGTIGSFLWLVGLDLVHPLVIYLLQLYLTF